MAAGWSEEEHGYELIKIITASCTDHQQDAWLTIAHVEAALQKLREQAPYLDGLYFQADNAPNYHCSQILYQLPGEFTQSTCAQADLYPKCCEVKGKFENVLCTRSEPSWLTAARLLPSTVHA